MRVLHLTRDFPPSSCGGVSTAVGGLVEALGLAGVTCAVASFDGWRPAQKQGAELREPVREDQADLAVLRLEAPARPGVLGAFAAEQGPDLIHVHDALLWEQADAAPGGIPRLLTVHVYQAELNRLRGVEHTLSRQAEDHALAQADGISAPSAWVAERLSGDHPKLAARIRVAGWGLPPGLPEPTRPLPVKRVLYVGRFGDVKGSAELGEVIGRILGRSAQIRFTVVGGLPHNQRAERRWRKRLADAVVPGDRDRLEQAGWLAGADLEARYAEASAALVPSRFETFGLTALEAMARGLPVVATRAGGLPELIEHKKTGLLCDPGDVAGLTAQLEKLLASPDLATRLGDAACARVQADYLWPDRIGRWLELYGAL